MRTYAGHSTAAASNELYRTNLAKGQTGLSVAFDLPTQTGYDPDSPLAHGEVGKVGVPVPHLGEMRKLFEGIPLAEMNTSMTINAPAMWLLALYQVVAESRPAWGPAPRTRNALPSPPGSRARRRTTSSRSTSRAAPMCSRPSTRCG
ncbi:MAG: methylmalonyl-CoA mutase family protein [Nocardioides sp.]